MGSSQSHPRAVVTFRVQSIIATNLPRLVLSQNLPFAPMFASWTSGQRTMPASDRVCDRQRSSEMIAPVLSNSKPPYSLAGGVREALEESNGWMSAVNNEPAVQAARLFEELEGIDIDPAAGVAFASLRNAVETGRIPQSAVVLLHITGGGWKRQQREHDLLRFSPSFLELVSPTLSPQVAHQIRRLFRL
jgi:cysteate synthase